MMRDIVLGSCRHYSDSLKQVNSVSHIPIFSDLLFNAGMKTIGEIRRENMLIAQDRVGGAEQLAELADLSAAYLSQIKNKTLESKTKKEKQMGDKAARKIEIALGEPVGWMDADHTTDFSQHRNVAPAPVGTRKIPLISYVQAGSWTDTIDPYHPGDAHEWLLTDLELSEYAFGLEIKGNSMAPEFNPGDRVIIDPAVSPRPGDFVVAKNGEEEATFKKYRPRGRNEKGEQVIELAPLNPDYESMRSDITPFIIIGTMVEARRYRKK